MTALSQALSAALLHFVWQGSLVAVVLWAALFGLRRRPAAWRYGASCAALAVLAALPPVTVWVLMRGARSAGAVRIPAAFYFAAAGPAARPAVSWLARAEGWALPVWSLGVLLLSIRLVWGAGQIYGLRRRGEPATGAVLEMVERLAARMGVRRPVAVWISRLADGPSVVGWMRPLILLPSATLLGLTPQQLEAVLAHELAHIGRFDYAVNLAQMLVETLLFYHPAVWWVSARMRHERELCCDDRAVESCGNALCYARALTRLERLRLVAPGMAMASTGGPLLYRIQRLMGVAGAEYRPSRWPAIVTVCVGLGCLALNVHWAKAQEQAQPAQTTVTVTTQGESKTVNVPLHFFAREASYRDRGVQIDTGGATVLKREPVEYPGPAIERNIQGVVTVEAIQDANGEVTDAHVLAGPQELRKAALQSVLEWRFQPAAAGTSRQVNITFQIPPGGFPKEPQEGQQFIVRGPNVAVAKKLTAERAEQTLAFLEDEVRVFKLQYQGQLEAGTSPEADAKFLDWKAKLDAAQLALKIAKEHAVVGEDSAAAVVGRTVRSINSRGLPEGRSAELLGRLQFHVGDTVTADSLEQFEGAVRQFDEQMVIGYTLTEGNQVEIHLVYTPGEGTVRVRK